MSHRRGFNCGRDGEVHNMSGSHKENKIDNMNFNMAIDSIATNAQLIASQTEHLHRTRQRCTPTALLAQEEVRNFEEKILKLFSLQLRTKRELPQSILPDDIKEHPSVKQWLEIVGLDKDAVERLCCHLSSIEKLLGYDPTSLKSIADQSKVESLQKIKFVRAVTNLKNHTESQINGSKEAPPGSLSWDSWELCDYRVSSTDRTSVSSSDGESGSGGSDSSAVLSMSSSLHSNAMSIKGSDTSSSPSKVPPQSPCGSSPGLLSAACSFQDKYTPPPTPPIILKSKPGVERKFPPTPPPGKKNILQSITNQTPSVQISQDTQQQLGRSTSHESRLSLRLDSETDTKVDGIEAVQSQHEQTSRRSRLQSDSEVCNKPGKAMAMPEVKVATSWGDICEDHKKMGFDTSSKILTQHVSSGEASNNSKGAMKMPIKTSVPGSMGHNVRHRFARTLKREICCYCKKRITFSGGLRCKDCNCFCHRDCKQKLAPSCGLPPEMLEYFINEKEKGTQLNEHQIDLASGNITSIHQESSSNTSSCNSSTPSSPALMVPTSPARKAAFPFAEHLPSWEYNNGLAYGPNGQVINNNVVDPRLAHDSEKTLSNNSGSGSAGTDDSERTIAPRVDSQDLSEGDGTEPRYIRQNSVSSSSQSMREWDILYDELEHGDIIGRGRFATVYAGQWHGSIAIKELNVELANDEETLEAFREEVSTFQKTRHENLILFMGACMRPPRFAIITSLMKGFTLYQHIHTMKERFPIARTIPIARQITQAMGYLHSKGIVHKDVKTKNIFLEGSEKVVVTDFGLFDVTRLRYNRRGDWLTIPHGWLCYLAPEIIRQLRLDPKPEDVLPFTSCSDVFAFGTVWYELLCGEWPHKDYPPETVIWQVGRGMKPCLAHLQAPRNFKDILMLCWAFRPEQRPKFSTIWEEFQPLKPLKRLDRSPSHPVHLSRSVESVF